MRKNRHSLKILVPMLLLGCAAMINAAPVSGKLDSLQQPDGSSVQVRIWGDEYYQHVESLDGRTLVRDESTGWICYAISSEDGNELYPTAELYLGTEQSGIVAIAEDDSKRGFNNPIRLNRSAILTRAAATRGLLDVESVSEENFGIEAAPFVEAVGEEAANIDGPSNVCKRLFEHPLFN